MPNTVGRGYRAVRRSLLRPSGLHSRANHDRDPTLLPDEPGIYAWYFDAALRGVPRQGCHGISRRKLLYVGISPSRATSSGTLRSRIRYHLTSNVSGSTLRTTLACLLAQQLRARLRRVGSRGTIKLTHRGEDALSEWMAQHARVCWAVCEEPWVIEPRIIGSLSLPLNLDHNSAHPFYSQLRELRSSMVRQAKHLPPVSGS